MRFTNHADTKDVATRNYSRARSSIAYVFSPWRPVLLETKQRLIDDIEQLTSNLRQMEKYPPREEGSPAAEEKYQMRLRFAREIEHAKELLLQCNQQLDGEHGERRLTLGSIPSSSSDGTSVLAALWKSAEVRPEGRSKLWVPLSVFEAFQFLAMR